MKTTYSKAMKIELKYEGGKDDDPVDPGGRTNQGVIQREYSAWRIQKGLPNRDVFLMEPAERDEIYYENYATKIHYDELPIGVDLVVLDGSINSGPSQSIKWVQRALGIVADGVMGTLTLERIVDHSDHDLLIALILERRRAYLRALTTFSHFGNGWMTRVDSLQRTGQLWASGSVGPAVVDAFIPNGNKKAKVVDARRAPPTAPADITTGGGIVASTLSTVQSTLSPLQGHSPIIDNILLGCMVAGAALAGFGLVYGWWARRQRDKLNDALDLVPVRATNNNDDIPTEVLSQYVDPRAQGSATGNIAPGHVTTSGRVAGDTEFRVNSSPPGVAA
jgi:lysozyme family protein